MEIGYAMPASVVPISGSREGTFLLLVAALPGRSPQPVGVILVDPATDRAWVRLRERFDALADPEDAEVFAALEDDLRERFSEHGAEAALVALEDSLSNALRVGERQTVAVDAFTRILTGSTTSMWKRPRFNHFGPISRCIACGRRLDAWERKWSPPRRIGSARRKA
jgi:hypothetical protein